MEALVGLARQGPDAIPLLLDALQRGSPSVREFAAQVLAMLAEPATKPALLAALADTEHGVRVHAIKGLTMFGPLELTDEQRQLLEQDSHWMLRHYIGIAVARDDTPDPQAIQRALCEYDLGQMDTARVGHMAPDFSLADATGHAHRLSDFRGQKTVILEFHPGDG
jgi:HEAT repeat protein